MEEVCVVMCVCVCGGGGQRWWRSDLMPVFRDFDGCNMRLGNHDSL